MLQRVFVLHYKQKGEPLGVQVLFIKGADSYSTPPHTTLY